jgi:hypothetical protein
MYSVTPAISLGGRGFILFARSTALHSRVSTILEIFEILKGESRFRIFKKKMFGKLVSDFL